MRPLTPARIMRFPEGIRNASPNLLASRLGRAVAFFSFYFIDGVLVGFMAMAIAVRMKAGGVTEAKIGLFVAAVYLPASWKWLFGPLVDLCYSDRLGRRRGWILGMEALMIAALLAASQVDFAANFAMFTGLLMLVNLFAALQRIAVNALACNILADAERGTANGMMYAGAYLGQILGGSGVVLLSKHLSFSFMFMIVAGSIFAVMLFIALPLREPKTTRDETVESGLAGVATEVRRYAIRAFNAFRASRAALVGLIFVLLPAGSLALSLSLGTNLMVEFGLSEESQSAIFTASVLVAAATSFAGGFLADRFGRRKTLALYIVGSALPALWMAYVMHQHGWIMPGKQGARGAAPYALISSYWIVVILGSAFQGLLYTTRSAMFMDICTPAVAATQFTAYVALVNLTVSYSSAWQGHCLAKCGYPVTLTVDALLGMVSLPLLFLMTRARAETVSEECDSTKVEPPT